MKGEPYPVQCESPQHRAQVRTAGSQSQRFGYANLPLLLLRCQSIQLSVIPVSAPVTPFIPHQAPGSSYNPQRVLSESLFSAIPEPRTQTRNDTWTSSPHSPTFPSAQPQHIHFISPTRIRTDPASNTAIGSYVFFSSQRIGQAEAARRMWY